MPINTLTRSAELLPTAFPAGANAAAETELLIPDLGQPHDAIMVDDSHTYVIANVGMAQAGKTTLLTETQRLWRGFSDAPALTFSNSRYYRALTADEMMRHGVDLTQAGTVEAAEYSAWLDASVGGFSDEELAHRIEAIYDEHSDEVVLRNDAVNGSVPLTAEHPRLRPLVNRLGAFRLRELIAQEQPGLVLIDARNRGECRQKCSIAGAEWLGLIITRCDEDAIASRQPGLSAEDRRRFADGLRRRNANDRDRTLGPMTLPRDFRAGNRFLLDAIMREPDGEVREREAVRAGMLTAMRPRSALVVDTENFPLPLEVQGIDLAVSGMFLAAQHRDDSGRIDLPPRLARHYRIPS